MSDIRTKPTEIDPAAFVAALDHPVRRAAAEHLLDLIGRITGWPARMWGPSMIGFGRYRYKYDSGRAGEAFVTGFSPRKAHLVVYAMPGYRALSEPLGRLGKHKLGKACLYINKLADVDVGVLEAILAASVADMKARHETWPE